MGKRPRLRLFAALAAMAALSGCGSKGTPTGFDGGAGSAGDAPSDRAAEASAPSDALPTTPTEVCVAAIEATCERLAACEGVQKERCMGLAVFCPDYYFGVDSNRTVANLAACLPALRARTCTDVSLGLYPPCLVHGNRPEGAGCAFPSQCLSNLCGDLGQCSTCLPADAPTAPTRYAMQGELCNLSSTPPVGCVGDLQCRKLTSGAASSTCQLASGPGGPCAGMLGDCARGTTCVMGECAPIGACGAATCDVSSYCKPGDGGMTCAAGQPTGQPCGDPIRGGGPPCAPGLVCAGKPDAGSCVAPSQPGEACDLAKPCIELVNCIAGKCETLRASDCPVDAGAGDGRG
jgi:hypothetical protein